MSQASSPRRKVTIDLAEPVELFGQRIARLTLREPGGAAYSQLGEPCTPVFGQSGSVFVAEQPSVIRAYLEQQIEVDDAAALLNLLSLQDYKTLKETLLGFFRDAEANLATRKPTNSSSASAS